MGKIAEKAKDNPLMTILVSAGVIATAMVSIWKGIDLVDNMVYTHQEADLVHAAYDKQLEDLKTDIGSLADLNECRWLSDKIDQLEYEIYVLKRDHASSDFIQSKESSLRAVRDKFVALKCASII